MIWEETPVGPCRCR